MTFAFSGEFSDEEMGMKVRSCCIAKQSHQSDRLLRLTALSCPAPYMCSHVTSIAIAKGGASRKSQRNDNGKGRRRHGRRKSGFQRPDRPGDRRLARHRLHRRPGTTRMSAALQHFQSRSGRVCPKPRPGVCDRRPCQLHGPLPDRDRNSSRSPSRIDFMLM